MNMMRAYAREERGVFGMSLAIMLFLIAAIVGVTVDYTRAAQARIRLQPLLDGASLSASRALAFDAAITDGDLRAIVTEYIAAVSFFEDADMNCGAPQITIDRVQTSVSVGLDCRMDMYLPLLHDTLPVVSASTADFEWGDIEVAFMIDVSGSMRGSRMSALQTALRDAVRILLDGEGGDVRIAFAPYSWAVNAGPFAEAALTGNVTSNPLTIAQWSAWRAGEGSLAEMGVRTGENCVTERRGGNAFTNVPPTTEVFRERASTCNSAPIVPLTDDGALLNREIDALVADGMTAGHLGIAWAWYLVSERWSGFWPAANAPLPAGNGRKKFVVIMTDGMFNRRYENSNGNSTRQSRDLCRAMQDDGVTIFSVAFQAPNSVLGTLRDCASSPAFFFNSSTAAELQAAYQAIVDEITTNRLVQ